MSGRLSHVQIRQMTTLVNCATGELRGKTDIEGPSGLGRVRKRYKFMISCRTCDSQYRASWADDALAMLSLHMHHTTRLDAVPAKDVRTMPSRNAARLDAEKDRIDATIRRYGELALSEIVNAVGLHPRTVTRRLREMEEDGEVIHTGERRWSLPKANRQ